MSATERLLPSSPVASLEEYRARGGGRGLEAARKLGPAGIVDEVEASGLRGRGGAGFPTGVKWRTVAGLASAALPATVVVNGAEGEPGSFKDRALMRADPYSVLEGAVIAALAVGADRAIVAVKASFARERSRLERAIAEFSGAGMGDGVELSIATGPDEYLFGEETGLLEVLDGRPPFPRIAPPFRHGVDEVSAHGGEPGATQMARPGPGGPPPTLANNVETMANVPGVLAEGADWFRAVGTAESPGTIICTVSGATERAGVAEFAMGTPLGEVIHAIGRGPQSQRRLAAAMSGVANPIISAELFDTPLTYEDMKRVGSGLGAAGFIVFDDQTDLAAVAAGVSRFLAVESCGQCTPCKQDGLAMAEMLARLCAGDGDEQDVEGVVARAASVADEARCFLAQQHQMVVESVLRLFPDALRHHLGSADHVVPEPILPIRDITDDGRVELDARQLEKQPDWTFEAIDSGRTPVDRLRDQDVSQPR